MAIDLKKLEKPSGQRPVIITLFGEGGIGKTTLASLFPKPVIMRVEDGTRGLAGDGVRQSPIVKETSHASGFINALMTQEHDFLTLVVDSVTQYAVVVEEEILAEDGRAKSLNQALGGYGAGFSAAADRHRQLRELCGDLSNAKGMNIIFIGHADREEVDPPDMDKYSRYTMRLHKKCIGHYTDNVDAVCQIRLKTFVAGDDDRKLAISSGEREILCHPQASSITKNRFGVTEPLSFAFDAGNPFEKWLPK